MTDRPMTRNELLDCTKNTDYEVEGQLLTGTHTHSDNPEDLEASSVQMLPRTALTLWTRGDEMDDRSSGSTASNFSSVLW